MPATKQAPVVIENLSNEELEAAVKAAEAEAYGGTAASRMGGVVNAQIVGGAQAVGGFFKGLIAGNKSPAQKRAELLARLQQVK
jgi:hypothetical protein